MGIDIESAILILGVVAKSANEGMQLNRELGTLAQRALDGDKITNQELLDAQAGRRVACSEFEVAAGSSQE